MMMIVILKVKRLMIDIINIRADAEMPRNPPRTGMKVTESDDVLRLGLANGRVWPARRSAGRCAQGRDQPLQATGR
jgi:hypothetical protein